MNAAQRYTRMVTKTVHNIAIYSFYGYACKLFKKRVIFQ